MKRVLLLTPGFQGADGISAHSRLCIDALSLPDVELTVASLADYERRHDFPATGVRAFFAGGSKHRFATFVLRQAFHRPDIVLCTHLALAQTALPLTLLGSKLVVVLHGVEAWKPLRRLEMAAIKRAKLLIAVSRHTVGRFHVANPKAAGVRIEVCHNALPDTSPPPRAAALNGPPFALIVARMSSEERYKGHDLLLEIWNEVRAKASAARLVVAGDGDDRKRLEAKRDALGMQDSVEFLGRVPDEQLQSLYRDCAFFVMPSSGEGFGLVFLEAIRAGKACIGAVGSASEIIVHSETGFVFDADDRSSIRDACIRLFNDPELAARLGENGRRREAEVFDKESFGKRLRELVLEKA